MLGSIEVIYIVDGNLSQLGYYGEQWETFFKIRNEYVILFSYFIFGYYFKGIKISIF